MYFKVYINHVERKLCVPSGFGVLPGHIAHGVAEDGHFARHLALKRTMFAAMDRSGRGEKRKHASEVEPMECIDVVGGGGGGRSSFRACWLDA